MISEILIVLTAYLLGSIPTSIWLSKSLFDIDIRDYGSGNAGATNTFRILGARAGIFVMFADMIKAFIAVKLAYFSGFAPGSEQFISLQVILGIVAVLGHIFPIFAQFKGGKGIASLFGMIVAIQFEVAIALVLVFALILLFTRYVSLSSIIASIAFPVMILFVFNEPELLYRVFAIATAILVVLTHQKNITRLLDGNESKIKLKKKH